MKALVSSWYSSCQNMEPESVDDDLRGIAIMCTVRREQYRLDGLQQFEDRLGRGI